MLGQRNYVEVSSGASPSQAIALFKRIKIMLAANLWHPKLLEKKKV